MNCRWLPKLLPYPDWSKYDEYENNLYEIFKDLYVIKYTVFNGCELKFRVHPRNNNREESFYHMTCYEDDEYGRTPDLERMIRIKWPDALFENYCCKNECCDNKPLYWIKKDRYSNKDRHHILFKRYLVVVEERKEYFLFTTAFYIEDEFYFRGKIKEYKRYMKQKALS